MSVLRKLSHCLPDELYIQLQYFHHFHKFANLKHPQTFNEKLNWLKLHDRNPLYTTLVDKYAVKQWVADKIGAQYIIPTLGVWNKAEDIDFDKLPHQFVLKCTHDSHSIVICRDKSKLDKPQTIKKLSARLKSNGYWYGREWPYKNVPPRIIAEKYMEDASTGGLVDFKFLCFSGHPQFIEVHRNRFTQKYSQLFYDMQGHVQAFNNKNYKTLPVAESLPQELLCQIRPLVDVLAGGFAHVRVDFYYIDAHPYFSEMTFYDGSGFVPFEPPQVDRVLGNYLTLPKLL